jgi:two-component system response regulator AtoC
VGGTDSIQTNCRVIAATNINLSEAVAAGRFREDLFYRLNVFSVETPALRERLEDIPLLVDHFLVKLAERNLPRKTFSRLAISRLLSYDWPGNVRELEHVIEQATVTTPGPVVEPGNLPDQIVASHEEPFSLDFDLGRPLPEITNEFTCRIECAYLKSILEKYRGRIELCAQHCGLSRRSISEKLRRYQIDKRDFKPRTSRRRQFALIAGYES